MIPNMVKIKTSELRDVALDWVVATIEGYENLGVVHSKFHLRHFGISEVLMGIRKNDEGPSFCNFSYNWAHAGSIIEMEEVELYKHQTNDWTATIRPNRERGATPLIAVMRCYVASKLGEEVEVPIEFVMDEMGHFPKN